MTRLFEETIPIFKELEETLSPQAYTEIPQEWIIVIADVVNSTQAIQEGRYRDINALGGSIIAAVLNATKPRKLPFVFGGDGASFCIPPQSLNQVKKALKGCQEMARKSLNLQLRVGLIPCSELHNAVKVCRLQRASNLTQFFFTGNGLEEAENRVKDTKEYHLEAEIEADADFSGFECRWNLVPGLKEITFSLLVKPRLKEPERFLQLIHNLTRQLNTALGDEEQRHPLSSKQLSMSFNADKLKAEVASKSQNGSWLKRFWVRFQLRLENLIGGYWMSHHTTVKGYNWGNYRQELIDNSDYEKLDDLYRCVMTADRESLDQLIRWLEDAYQKGELYYGVHQTDAAIVTCLVSQDHIKHVHFVDSAEGGYAMAAKQLKKQVQHTEET